METNLNEYIKSQLDATNSNHAKKCLDAINIDNSTDSIPFCIFENHQSEKSKPTYQRE